MLCATIAGGWYEQQHQRTNGWQFDDSSVRRSCSACCSFGIGAQKMILYHRAMQNSVLDFRCFFGSLMNRQRNHCCCKKKFLSIGCRNSSVECRTFDWSNSIFLNAVSFWLVQHGSRAVCPWRANMPKRDASGNDGDAARKLLKGQNPWAESLYERCRLHGFGLESFVKYR